MKKFIRKVSSAKIIDDFLILDYDQRVKSRLKADLQSGESVGVFMDRGTVLHNDDFIATDNNFVVQIVAAKEHLSCVYSDDLFLLAKACYHLGNRHVKLQIERDMVCYQHDHVLDKMLVQLGFVVVDKHMPFSPESGAYEH